MSLKDLVQKAKQKKRQAKVFAPNKQGLKIFEVDMRFDVKSIRHIREIVLAKNEAEARTIANQQFKKRDLTYIFDRAKSPRNSSVAISSGKIYHIKQLRGASLSGAQRRVLEHLVAGFKLYPRYADDRTYSKVLKLSEKDEVLWSESHRYVSVNTIDALYRKGLILPYSQVMLNEKEIKIQKALGTLPKDTIFMLNQKRVDEFKLRIKPYVEKGNDKS